MTAVYAHGPLGGMRRGVRRKAAGPLLRSLPWDELYSRLASAADDATAGALVSAMDSKERSERARARWQREVDASGWTEASYAQYLEAEAACSGRLVTHAAVTSWHQDTEAWPYLWTCPQRDADRYASEELRNFWLDHPRLTPGAHLRQLRSATRAAEAAALDGSAADRPEDVSVAPRDAQTASEAEVPAAQTAAPRETARPWAAAMHQRLADGSGKAFDLGRFGSKSAAMAACQGIARRMAHELSWSAFGHQTYTARAPHGFAFAVSNQITTED